METSHLQTTRKGDLVSRAIHDVQDVRLFLGAGVIIHAGRKRQLFTGPLREVILALDPMCGWLGCTLRSQICDIDHLEPRSRGGPTDAANAKVMCDRHNIFKHVNGYTVERSPDGIIQITRPDGTPLGVPDAA